MTWDFEGFDSEQLAVRHVLRNLGFKETPNRRGFSYNLQELALLLPSNQTLNFDLVLEYLNFIQKKHEDRLKETSVYVPFATLYIRISFGKRIWNNCHRIDQGKPVDPPEPPEAA